MREPGELNHRDFPAACGDCDWRGLFYDLEAHAESCPGRAPSAPVDPPCPTTEMMRAKADRLIGNIAEGLGLTSPRFDVGSWALPFMRLLILITEELWGPGEVKVNDE